MTIVDAGERRSALDPCGSFCVSAPAGSGKTELLIQRYLSLLTRVARPEQVLAITFTRKAAAEMKQRVIQSLVDAKHNTACDTQHQQATRQLALQALEADSEQQWQLLDNPSRLNIKTIDSFCAGLVRQMPVLSEFGAHASIVEQAQELYTEAVQELFARLEQSHPIATDLKALLAHFDNNWQQVQQLLVNMLARRDQWGDYIGIHHDPDGAEAHVGEAVARMVAEDLLAIQNAMAQEADELIQLQAYQAQQLDGLALSRLPATSPEATGQWRALSQLLLTKTGSWRKTVDKRSGFPSQTAEHKARKTQLLELIGRLRLLEGLEQALQAVNLLPSMEGESESWQLVVHLSRLLPHLAAELLLVFANRGQVDHSQVALSALQALGEDLAPTELALRLDYSIEHILVDEFQDTAFNQYELIRRLTRGWAQHNAQNPSAPRTIMVVGDGMQSIYGFRDANVGLFLKARQQGFNGVTLQHLPLRCNFRSDEGVVDWVNQTFSWAFPQRDNISRGQVRFTEAVAVKPDHLVPAVMMHGFAGDGELVDQAEVDLICRETERGVADSGCKSIAILGRSRSQLQPIIAAFRRRGIDYSAQDMDRLAQSALIIDLLSLCRALNNPADRVAWLAILRAPWCGLRLADLHRLAHHPGAKMPGSLWANLNNPELLAGLSEDGRHRAQHLLIPLQHAFATRDRLNLRVWVEQLWLGLGGAAVVDEALQLADAEQFFQLLEQAEQEGVGLSISWLERRLDGLYMNAENPHSKVQLMTLHRAKGLEFDWVFIPRLGRKTGVDQRRLLEWDEHSSEQGKRSFMLAADDHSGSTEPTLYNYLRSQRKAKTRLELTRLLYVGCTRAVSYLLLSAALKADGKDQDHWAAPASDTLLSCIWPTFSQQMTVQDCSAEAADQAIDHAEVDETTLYRLPLGLLNSGHCLPESGDGDISEETNIPTASLNWQERHVGTVIHQVLEHYAGSTPLPKHPSESDRRQWSWRLQQLGLLGESLDTALASVEQSICTTLADDKGRWILDAQHQDSARELAISYSLGGATGDLVIDRTFIDQGIRWIIDYKSSRPEAEQPLADFLAQETASYSDQLDLYRRAMQSSGELPVRCALYFTALGLFHTLLDSS